MSKDEKTMLNGMKEICNFTSRAETTVLKWFREYNFPAKKVGGRWISDTEMIKKWYRNMEDR
jgi:hypothetical protein